LSPSGTHNQILVAVAVLLSWGVYPDGRTGLCPTSNPPTLEDQPLSATGTISTEVGTTERNAQPRTTQRRTTF